MLNTNYHRDKDYVNFEKMFRNIFQKRVNLISSYLSHLLGGRLGGRVLEIGCSNGVFLDLFKEKKYETWGVEPSESAKIAGKKGHKIIRGFFESVSLPTGFFDLVIINHTLEHMDNPVEVLKKVHKVLKKDGVVFVDVPNFGSLSSKILGKRWPYLLPEEHKHQFTKESLTNLLINSGFKVIHWESRSGIFEYANPALELWQALSGFKKRFFFDILTSPYCLVASALQMGDSMSFFAKKKGWSSHY